VEWISPRFAPQSRSRSDHAFRPMQRCLFEVLRA
jgi:hypothetical protein